MRTQNAKLNRACTQNLNECPTFLYFIMQYGLRCVFRYELLLNEETLPMSHHKVDSVQF